jgi:hypothetical protein
LSEDCRKRLEDALERVADSVSKIISKTGSLVFVNDHHGHAAALALFDKAMTEF